MKKKEIKMQHKELKSTLKEKSHEEIGQLADEQKREFMKKFGKYATSAPVGMFVLMSMGSSKAHAGSDTGP